MSSTGLVSERLRIRGTQVEGEARTWKGADAKQELTEQLLTPGTC